MPEERFQIILTRDEAELILEMMLVTTSILTQGVGVGLVGVNPTTGIMAIASVVKAPQELVERTRGKIEKLGDALGYPPAEKVTTP